jgi:hypothetical protein
MVKKSNSKEVLATMLVVQKARAPGKPYLAFDKISRHFLFGGQLWEM